ncbi:Aim17 protein [Saccharomycopsis crataegensis]|uniref:Aim17 protein n=1 Tax=Saccharomycopsis crataegensis TaxID=43959 RepID=A0AAV5QS50_9ASCO|nr:Aim17 protein [Saccharomycopsis crataegensis]
MAQEPSLKINFFNERVISVSFLDVTDTPLVPGVVNFSNVFLRDASTSLDSINPISKQKLFSTGQISRGIRAIQAPQIISVSATDGVSEWAMEVNWSDGNVSIYKESFLKKYSSPETRIHGRYFEENWQLWDNSIITKAENHLFIDFDKYMEDEPSLLQAMKNLNKYGLTFIKNIPKQLDSEGKPKLVNDEWFVESIAQRIGYIRETFYGRLFDVQSKKDAKNIAYTNGYLGLHMDLMYYESPPQLQLLHSITNRVEGGGSFFADSYAAVNEVSETDTQAYTAMTEIPVNFHYDNAGENYWYSRPMVVEDPDQIDPRTDHQLIRHVNYSPPFQAPFDIGITSPLKKIGEFENLSQLDIGYRHSAAASGKRHVFREFHRGLQAFEKFINNESNQYKLKLEEGVCVIFDNRRVLHAREGFNSKDNCQEEIEYERWFKGAYIDTDAYYSKMRVLFRRYGVDKENYLY